MLISLIKNQLGLNILVNILIVPSEDTRNHNSVIAQKSSAFSFIHTYLPGKRYCINFRAKTLYVQPHFMSAQVITEAEQTNCNYQAMHANIRMAFNATIINKSNSSVVA